MSIPRLVLKPKSRNLEALNEAPMGKIRGDFRW